MLDDVRFNPARTFLIIVNGHSERICGVTRRGRPDPLELFAAALSVGLWVGRKTTPNTLTAAAESLRQGRVGGRPHAGGTPHQITSCPWCGTEIREMHLRVYEAPSDIGRCITYCGDSLGRCEFSEAK